MAIIRSESPSDSRQYVVKRAACFFPRRTESPGSKFQFGNFGGVHISLFWLHCYLLISNRAGLYRDSRSVTLWSSIPGWGIATNGMDAVTMVGIHLILLPDGFSSPCTGQLSQSSTSVRNCHSLAVVEGDITW